MSTRLAICAPRSPTSCALSSSPESVSQVMRILRGFALLYGVTIAPSMECAVPEM